MMQTDFKAIVQSEYGAPEKVLKIAKRQLKSDKLGAQEALLRVITRPIHVGDVHIVEALPQGGPIAPIPEGTLRTPGFEGLGTIVRLGTGTNAAKRFIEGQRVAFFPANGSWAEYVIVNQNSLVASTRDFRYDIGANAHKYNHRVLPHQDRSQFDQTSDYASRLHSPECCCLRCWAFADTNRFRSRCAPHSLGAVSTVRRKAKFYSPWRPGHFNGRKQLEKASSRRLGRTQA